MGFTSSNSPLTPQWRYSQRVCTCRYSGFEGSVTLLRESLASRELRLRLKSLSSSLSSHQRHRFPFRTPPAACGWLCRRCWSSLSPLVQSSGRGGRRRVVWCGVVLTTLSVAHRPPEGGRPHPSRPDLLGVVTSNRNALSGAHECGGQLCHCAPRFRRPHDAGRRNAKAPFRRAVTLGALKKNDSLRARADMAPTSDARPANAWTNGDRQTLPRVMSSRPAARPGGIVPTRRAATPSLTQAPAATESRNLRSAPAADQGLPPSGRTSHTAGTSGGEHAVPPTRWAGWATDSQLPQQGESDERYARLVARERAVAAREAGALRMTSQAQVMHNRDVARLHRELAESREATRVQAAEVARLEELVTSLQMEAAAAARERKAALQSQATSPASMAQLERLQLAMRKQQAEYETKVATLQEELERTSLALARTRAEADELGAALASERRRHATHVESTHAFQQRLRGEMDDIATMSASLAANSESHMRGVVEEARQTTADAISDVRAAREHTAGTVSDMRGDVERWSDNFAERITARREARRRHHPARTRTGTSPKNSASTSASARARCCRAWRRSPRRRGAT